MVYRNAKIRGTLQISGNLQFNVGTEGLPTFTNNEVNTWLNTLFLNGITSPSFLNAAATDNFITALKTTGIRSKITRLNLFNGGEGNWLGAFFPIIHDAGPSWDWNGIYGSTVDALANGPFQSQDYSFIGGLSGYRVNSTKVNATRDSTGAYLDTGIPTNDATLIPSNNNVHFAAYAVTPSLGGSSGSNTPTFIGTDNLTANNPPQIALQGGSTNKVNQKFIAYDVASQTYNGGSGTIATNLTGFFVGTRANNSYAGQLANTFYRDGVQSHWTTAYPNPNTTATTQPATNSTTTTCVFTWPGGPNAGNKNAGLGVAKPFNYYYCDQALTMYSIGYGLTNTDVVNYYNAINAFNTAIGRLSF